MNFYKNIIATIVVCFVFIINHGSVCSSDLRSRISAFESCEPKNKDNVILQFKIGALNKMNKSFCCLVSDFDNAKFRTTDHKRLMFRRSSFCDFLLDKKNKFSQLAIDTKRDCSFNIEVYEKKKFDDSYTNMLHLFSVHIDVNNSNITNIDIIDKKYSINAIVCSDSSRCLHRILIGNCKKYKSKDITQENISNIINNYWYNGKAALSYETIDKITDYMLMSVNKDNVNKNNDASESTSVLTGSKAVREIKDTVDHNETQQNTTADKIKSVCSNCWNWIKDKCSKKTITNIE